MNLDFLKKIKKTELKTADDYLTVPFMNTVNDESFYSTTQVMKILVGVTGQGKTFSTARVFIPHLINNHGVKFVIVSAPQKGILDKVDFSVGASKCNAQITDNIDDALMFAENDVPVILLKCHAAIMHDDKGQKLQNFLLENSIKFAVFVDEAHTWLCSDKENYKDVVGWPGNKHEAKYFKMLAKLSIVSPFMFGLTATPNAEQIGKISTIGDMSFEVINTFAPKPLLINQTAYFGNTKFYTPNHLIGATETAFEEFVNNVYDETESCGFKKTAIVACSVDNASNGFNKDVVKKLLINILTKNPYTSKDTKSIAIMTGKSEETGSYDLDGSFQKLTDDEIKTKLNDGNDPLMFLLVVNKGQMGMNVYTLKNYFTFKYTDKMDKSGDALEEFPIQGVGRLIRLNTGFSKVKDFTTKYGYDLGNYMKTLNKEEKKNLLVANTMNIVVPNNAMWGAAIDTFQKVYASSIVQAKTYFKVS